MKNKWSRYMKEYKLKINGEIDFIIISPQVFFSLISQIHSSTECEVAVNIEDIMPPGITDYLLRVINVNRFTNERRSEEHTSELQSRFDVECRLQLDKK